MLTRCRNTQTKRTGTACMGQGAEIQRICLATSYFVLCLLLSIDCNLVEKRKRAGIRLGTSAWEREKGRKEEKEG